MTDDIHLVLDRKPEGFRVHLYPSRENWIPLGIKFEPGIIRYAAARETRIASTFLLCTRIYPRHFSPRTGWMDCSRYPFGDIPAAGWRD
jgi:hypothetical protein